MSPGSPEKTTLLGPAAAAVYGTAIWMVFTLIARSREDIGQDAFDVPGWGLIGRGSMLIVALALGYLAGKWWILIAPAMNLPQMALLVLGTEIDSGLWIIGELIIVWYMVTNLAAAAVGASLARGRRRDRLAHDDASGGSTSCSSLPG